MPNAYDDRLLNRTKRQISKEYNDALLEAVRKSKDFLLRAQAVHDDKVQPPASLTTEKQIQAWKEGYLRRPAERVGVVSHMQSEMGAAGIRTRKHIEETMLTVYRRNQQNVNALLDRTLPAGTASSTREQIRVLLYGEGRMSAFTKISLDHLGTGRNPARRLQNELAVGLRNGEGQDQLLARIRKVTGMELDDAKRVLRTEMTHVESMAQQQTAMDHYLATGVKPMKRWHCMFHNSRDSHMAMNGQTVPVDEPFMLPSGGEIMYPGDSNAGPSEVCNCQCWMEILPSDTPASPGMGEDALRVALSDGIIYTSEGLQVSHLSSHVHDRMLQRGISEGAVVRALQNPLDYDPTIRYNAQGLPSVRYVGYEATVNINPITGVVTTVWPTGSKKRKKYLEERGDE